ncbi:MAG: hypothetical protein FWG85_03575 [Bacteroidetes bacterium]|nr:hypothetical protein [Bacteroidota bacterium]
MRVFTFLLLCFCFANKLCGFELQSGDILFQDGSNNGFNSAIRSVTTSIENYHFTHCGIYFVDSIGNSFVIEAISNGVVLTAINDFVNRYLTSDNKPKIVVGRLADSLQSIIPSVMQNALSYLGRNYDNSFDLTNDEIYCSELIYFSYIDNSGINVFSTNPMTFIDINTNETHIYWQKHFNLLGIPVPEGKEGINPGGISKSPKIDILFYYY